MKTPQYTILCSKCQKEPTPLFKLSLGYVNGRKTPAKPLCSACVDDLNIRPRALQCYAVTCSGGCGRDFYGESCHMFGAVYCCAKCQRRHHSRMYRNEQIKGGYAYNDDCNQCGDSYKVFRETSKFCSTRCRVKAHRAKAKKTS